MSIGKDIGHILYPILVFNFFLLLHSKVSIQRKKWNCQVINKFWAFFQDLKANKPILGSLGDGPRYCYLSQITGMVRCYNKRRVEGGRGYLVPRECVKWTSAYHTVQVFFRNITISACEGDKELGSYEINSMHIAQLPEQRTVLPNSFEDFAEIAKKW